MTDEQFETLRELLERILQKLEMINGDVDTLARAVDRQTGRIMAKSVQDY